MITFEEKKKFVKSKGFDVSGMSLEDIRTAYKDLVAEKETPSVKTKTKKCNDSECSCNKTKKVVAEAKPSKKVVAEAKPSKKVVAEAKPSKKGNVLCTILETIKEGGTKEEIISSIVEKGFNKGTVNTYFAKRKDLYTEKKNRSLLLTPEGKALLKASK